jgi:CubicO group peptidase (beta-lactamase class C family)
VAGDAVKEVSVSEAESSGEITDAGVQRGVQSLDSIVNGDMKATTVPGVAVGVVFEGRVLYSKGFGVRQVGQPGAVAGSTVFQLASLSKSISSTVVAAAVKQKKVAWTDPIQKGLPNFTLSDPWVSSHVTIADMFSHRSGLPDHSGDLLEDLGYSRDEILQRLRYEPLGAFRIDYAYTNYGLTAGGLAAANLAGQSWPDLAQMEVFRPLGMTSSSFRFSDLHECRNRAALHVKVDGHWRPDLGWDPDRQAPAGGVTSSVEDMEKWMTMLLADGKYDGQEIIDTAGLQELWAPQVVRQPAAKIGARTGFYGLGWNIDYDSSGRLLVQHSGAFGHGAATHVLLVPAARLGIVTLTNAYPVGLPEAINNSFLDEVKYGRQTQDWLQVFGQAFQGLRTPPPGTPDFSKPPATVTPAQPAAAYTGTYASPFWGDLVVTETNGGLTFHIGPKDMNFPLTHYTGDQFYFETQGESRTGKSGATFTVSGGRAIAVVMSAWNANGLGTFSRPD